MHTRKKPNFEGTSILVSPPLHIFGGAAPHLPRIDAKGYQRQQSAVRKSLILWQLLGQLKCSNSACLVCQLLVQMIPGFLLSSELLFALHSFPSKRAYSKWACFTAYKYINTLYTPVFTISGHFPPFPQNFMSHIEYQDSFWIFRNFRTTSRPAENSGEKYPEKKTKNTNITK